MAEDQHHWPEENVIAACNGWETGPDPRHDPFYYADDDEVEEEDGDDGYELVDVD